MSDLTPRKGMPSPRLDEREFRRRFLDQFQDPAFDPLTAELDKMAAAAWDAYAHGRKAPPHSRRAMASIPPSATAASSWPSLAGFVTCRPPSMPRPTGHR